MKISNFGTFLVMASISTAIFASELTPFSDWVQNRPNWDMDPTEISYAATRCGVLLAVIGKTFETNPSKAEDVTQGRQLVERGHSLAIFGGVIANNTGMTRANQNNRYKLLLEAYAETTKRNRAMHNNMFHGHIEDDLNFCIDLERKINAIISKMAK